MQLALPFPTFLPILFLPPLEACNSILRTQPKEKALAMDEVLLSPEKDAATSPAKGLAASPAKGMATSPAKGPAASPAKGAAASLAKGAAALPVLIRGLDWVPDSEDESECIDREEWRIRRGIKIPCSRCGLIHNEYEITSWIYGFKEFDCKVLFPNIDDLKMDGDTVLLPAQIWMADSDADIQDSSSVGEQQEQLFLVHCNRAVVRAECM
jgi:hypothetical protein